MNREPPFNQAKENRYKIKTWLIIGSIGVGIISIILVTMVKADNWARWTGLGRHELIETSIPEKDAAGNVISTTTIRTEPGKTLWDWLSLLGVPFTLAILGYIFQRQERKRTEDLSKEQRIIADKKEKEEILQNYLDRISAVLIDKDILAVISRTGECRTSEEKTLLDASANLVRARTLSILRRFGNDSQKINSVLRFLEETEIFKKTELQYTLTEKAELVGVDFSNARFGKLSFYQANLSRSNFSNADLNHLNLSETNFSDANLNGTNLSFANLEKANLKVNTATGTKFFSSNLKKAIINGVNLRGSYFFWANLSNADLSNTNLRKVAFGGADLQKTNLSGADLSGADLSGADLGGADLQKIKWDKNTQWPCPEEVAKAKNIPKELKQQIGIE